MASAERQEPEETDDDVTYRTLYETGLAAGRCHVLLSALGSSLLSVAGVHVATDLLEVYANIDKAVDCHLLEDTICGVLVKKLHSAFFEYNDKGDFKICRRPKVEPLVRSKSDDTLFDIYGCECIIAFKGICTKYTRSVLINPTPTIMENYNFMVLIETQIVEILRDGVQLCQVYNYVQSLAEKENPTLAKHLEKDFGFALNTDFQEEYPPIDPNDTIENALKEYRFPISSFKSDSVVINADNNQSVQEHMVFFINIKLTGLNEGGTEYSLSTGDTVLVQKDDPAKILTLFKGGLAQCLIRTEAAA